MLTALIDRLSPKTRWFLVVPVAAGIVAATGVLIFGLTELVAGIYNFFYDGPRVTPMTDQADFVSQVILLALPQALFVTSAPHIFVLAGTFIAPTKKVRTAVLLGITWVTFLFLAILLFADDFAEGPGIPPPAYAVVILHIVLIINAIRVVQRRTAGPVQGPGH